MNTLPTGLQNRLRLLERPLGKVVLSVRLDLQQMTWFEQDSATKKYRSRHRFSISTSRFGAGQRQGSRQTPLGLHIIAEKIGGGWPPGTVFNGRKPIGLTWRGMPSAPIVHRILWLEGCEPGFNQGGAVDSRSRYIYIHGTGHEPGIGRPASIGCVQLRLSDLYLLYDQIPCGTAVWIEEK